MNVALGRSVAWKRSTVRTGIFKTPIAGRARVERLGLEGDEQADRAAHGGPLKAVYIYPSEHYAFWERELPETDLRWGAFGENLTVSGLAEDRVHVGDRFRIGSTVLAATKPRFPCFKLGIRFGREDIIDRFLASGRTGFYLRVLDPGDVGAGDDVVALGGEEGQPSIADLVASRQRAEEE